MSMHPIQQAWARLFEELERADLALVDGTDDDNCQENGDD